MVLCAGDYTPEQLAGWAKLPVDDRWLPRKFAAGEVVLVAEDGNGTIVGFGERAKDEIVACYVHPLHTRRGVGAMLLRRLEQSALDAGIEKLRLDSSVTAEGFYRRCGYTSDSRAIHNCGNGTHLECVRMTKRLHRLTLRPATAADVPAIFDIRTSVGENAITLEKLAAVGITPASVTATLGKSRHGWVMVNAADNEVVAFSMVDVDENKVLALFTRPGWEDRGCGSALLDAATAYLFTRGATQVWLTTGSDTPAAKFYRRRGWIESGKIEPSDVRFVLNRP